MAEMLKIVITDSVAMVVNDQKKVSVDDLALIYYDIDKYILYVDTHIFRNVSEDKLEKYNEASEELKPDNMLAFLPRMIEYLNQSFIFSEIDVFDLMDTLHKIARDELKKNVMYIKYVLINIYVKMNETNDKDKPSNDTVKEANKIIEGELDIITMLKSGFIKPDTDYVVSYKKTTNNIDGVSKLESYVDTYKELIINMGIRNIDNLRKHKVVLLSLILEGLEK